MLEQVNTSDKQLEARLSVMLQSVHGTTHYWFHRHSELKCMIHEWAHPPYTSCWVQSPDNPWIAHEHEWCSPWLHHWEIVCWGPSVCFYEILSEISCLFHKANEKAGPGYCRPFYWKRKYQNCGATITMTYCGLGIPYIVIDLVGCSYNILLGAFMTLNTYASVTHLSIHVCALFLYVMMVGDSTCKTFCEQIQNARKLSPARH